MPSPSLSFFVLACLVQCRLSFEARILITTGSNFGSHFSVLSTVGRALVDRGHTVTALISDAHVEKAKDPRFEHLQFDAFYDSQGDVTRAWTDIFTKHLMAKKSSGFGRIFHWIPPNIFAGIRSCKDMIDHFVNKEHHYDLFLLDGHSSCSVFLAGRLGIPYVLLVPSGIKPSLARRHGVSDTTTYYPEMTTGLSYRMTFSQRISNTISGLIADIAIFFEYDALSFILSFDYNISTSVRNLVSSAQLILINSDFAVDFPFPLHPNVVTVGGLTTRPNHPLSKTWEDLMESSGDHGVVLFTLGTYAGSSSALTLPEMEKISRAFRALPQRIVWQIKGDLPPSLEVGENTHIVPWMPQNDLLGHPKLRALVFHGGNNGMYEALYHGVPMVVMPIVFDHPDVAVRIVDRGMGIAVDFFSFTSEELSKAIQEVINNSSYKENVLRWSSIFKANPQLPLERAVFWIDHVLKYGGDYLRTSRTELYFWQVYSLDVYAFLLLIVYLSYRVLKFGYIRQYHRTLLTGLFLIVAFPIRRVCPALRFRIFMSGNGGKRFWGGRSSRENGKV